jgi:hypothetical protein
LAPRQEETAFGMGSKRRRNQGSSSAEREPAFQPIEALPTITALIDGGLQDVTQLYRDLGHARERPHLLDDVTVSRIVSVHTESLVYARIFDEQLVRWGKLDLTTAQRDEVNRLTRQLVLYRDECQRLIDLGRELQQKTIDAIMRMSDEEVGLAVLSGQLPFG